MKNTLSLFTSILVLYILVSCSSDSSGDSSNEIPNEPVDFSIDLDRTVFGKDERIAINVSSSENLTQGCIGSNFFTNDMSEVKICRLDSGLGSEFEINFSFQTVGSKAFYVEVQTADLRVGRFDGEVTIDELTNSVRIKKITVNDYTNKGNAFDSGFTDTDPERLADLFFKVEKRYVTISVDDEDAPIYKGEDFLTSNILENETGFEWNYDGNELLVNKDNILGIQLLDDDGESNEPEIIGFIFVNFNDFVEEKPEQISIKSDLSRLDITIDVEWNLIN